MKKIIFALCMMMGLFMVSCQNGADMKSIVEKAKTEGANWSVDEWKDAFKEVMKGMKPMYEEMLKVQEETKALEGKSEEEQAAAAAEMMKKGEELQKKYGDVEKLMGEFEKAANATENGKKVANDEEFGKQVMKELGMEKIEI